MPGVKLNTPPFLRGNAQVELKDEPKTRHIASVRVHAVRAIASIKNYRTLTSTFQLKIWVICNYLGNFLSPLIAEKS